MLEAKKKIDLIRKRIIDKELTFEEAAKSFSDEKLIMNFNAVIDAIEKEKSNNTIKGDLIKQAFITSTMGVSYKIKLGKSI